MDVSKLVRNKSCISCLKELDDGRVVTSKECKIQIPARYIDRNMAYVGIDNVIIGYYAFIVEDSQYAVCKVPALMELDPYETVRVNIKGTEYIQFNFLPGNTVFKTLNLVKEGVLVYSAYEEFNSKGKIPWFFSPDDLCGLYDLASKHAGTSIGSNRAVTEIIASLETRDPGNRTVYYRSTITSLKDFETRPPVYVGLKNVMYGASNTVQRLVGAYLEEGVKASLIYPSERVEQIEELLRV